MSRTVAPRGGIPPSERPGSRSPAVALLSMAAWAGLGAGVAPILLPPHPGYRTAIIGAAVVLFAVALALPRLAFVLAAVAATASGFSALTFGMPEPAVCGPVLLSGYLAGSALRDLYEVSRPEVRVPLLPLLRGWSVTLLVSAAAGIVSARSGYALLYGVPPPRTVNVLGEDASQAIVATVAAFASMVLVAGFLRAAANLSDPPGRRAVDVGLVLAAFVPGCVALAQKVGVLEALRAQRWEAWNRSQATFTDPSAAGVAAALLVAPLLALAALGSGGRLVRVVAALSALLLLLTLADSGSRAGLIGTLTSVSLFVLWALTRVAAGQKPGVRRRVVSTVGSLAILASLAFAAALAWPTKGALRSALLARLEAPFQREATPSERGGNRLLLYEGAVALFREHPVTGVGLGGFRVELPNAAAELLLTPVRTTDYPPSLYLGSLVESGLAGTSLLVLVLLGILGAVSRSLLVPLAGASAPEEGDPEDLVSPAGRAVAVRPDYPGGRQGDALQAAGAGSALIGLLVVFLFGAHLVYPEVAVLTGILLARLPHGPEGAMSRALGALLPVVLAGALVLLTGGVLAKAYQTRRSEEAFARTEHLGVYAVEREPDGRPFRWTSAAAAFRVGGPPQRELLDRRPLVAPSRLVLPVRNARPDGRLVSLDVFWDERHRGRVTVPHGGWHRLELPIPGRGVLRLALSETFVAGRGDRRRLGLEVAPEPFLEPAR